MQSEVGNHSLPFGSLSGKNLFALGRFNLQASRDRRCHPRPLEAQGTHPISGNLYLKHIHISPRPENRLDLLPQSQGSSLVGSPLLQRIQGFARILPGEEFPAQIIGMQGFLVVDLVRVPPLSWSQGPVPYQEGDNSRFGDGNRSHQFQTKDPLKNPRLARVPRQHLDAGRDRRLAPSESQNQVAGALHLYSIVIQVPPGKKRSLEPLPGEKLRSPLHTVIGFP
jgi:hypothetical protein